MPSAAVTAVLWDFDNTLVDTRAKNLRVTRRIVEDLTGRPADGFPPLRSPEAYDETIARSRNWQDLYLREFGLPEEVMVRAGELWTEYQLVDPTPTPLFAGLAEAVRSLAHLPQGIVSMNSRVHIREILGAAGLLDHFRFVVGYEEVRLNAQKPAPDGLLLCLEALTAFAPGRVIYVGDHRTDVECAVRANEVLRGQGREVEVVAVAAAYGGAIDGGWDVTPRYRARTPADVVAIALGPASG